MTPDEIIRMAREAGWPGIYSKPLLSITMQEDDFLRFAALVAAAERNRCAELCDMVAANSVLGTANECATAIRGLK